MVCGDVCISDEHGPILALSVRPRQAAFVDQSRSVAVAAATAAAASVLPEFPPLGAAAPARLTLRVGELPPADFDLAVRILQAPVSDNTTWSRLENVLLVECTRGGPPLVAFFGDGSTFLIFHEGIWCYRSGMVFTEEIRASIFYGDGGIEHVD